LDKPASSRSPLKARSPEAYGCAHAPPVRAGGFEGKQIDTSKGTAFPPRLPSPFKFNVGVGQVIPGWDQSVKMMHVGEKRRIVVPASLGYGDKGVGPIPGGASLYFEVELLETKPVPEFSQKQLDWLATNPEP